MLQNDTILITGGGSGIGEAFALLLANDNRVIICGRNETKLKKVSSKNKNISYEVADISDQNSIDKLFISLKEKKIVLNVLFNNAGVVELWEVINGKLTTREIFEKVNTNLSGAIAVTQHFISQADHSAENMIVNNTSEIALMPVPIMPIYSATKGGLSVFTRTLRVQLQHTKFRVVELLTPSVDTDMPKQLNNNGKLLNTSDFVRSAIKNIKKGKLTYAPGPNVFLLKLFGRVAPVMGLKIIDKLSRKQLGVK